MKTIKLISFIIYICIISPINGGIIGLTDSLQIELKHYSEDSVGIPDSSPVSVLYPNKLFLINRNANPVLPFLSHGTALPQIDFSVTGKNPRSVYYPFYPDEHKLYDTYTDLYYGEGDYGFSRFAAFQRVVISPKGYMDFQLNNYSAYPQIANIFSTQKNKLVSLKLDYHFILKNKFKSSIGAAYYRNLTYLYHNPAYSFQNRELRFARKISFRTEGKDWESMIILQNGINQISEMVMPGLFHPGTDTVYYQLNQHYDMLKLDFRIHRQNYSIKNSFRYVKLRKNSGYNEDSFYLSHSSLFYRIGKSTLKMSGELSGLNEITNIHAGLEHNHQIHSIRFKLGMGYNRNSTPFFIRYILPDSLKKDVKHILQFSLDGNWKFFSNLSLAFHTHLFRQLKGHYYYPDMYSIHLNSPWGFKNDIALIYKKIRLTFKTGYSFAYRYGKEQFKSVFFKGQIPVTLFSTIHILNSFETFFYFKLNSFYYSFLYDYYFENSTLNNSLLINYFAYLPVKSFILYVSFDNITGFQSHILNFDGYQTPQFRFGFIWRLYQ